MRPNRKYSGGYKRGCWKQLRTTKGISFTPLHNRLYSSRLAFLIDSSSFDVNVVYNIRIPKGVVAPIPLKKHSNRIVYVACGFHAIIPIIYTSILLIYFLFEAHYNICDHGARKPLFKYIAVLKRNEITFYTQHVTLLLNEK